MAKWWDYHILAERNGFYGARQEEEEENVYV